MQSYTPEASSSPTADRRGAREGGLDVIALPLPYPAASAEPPRNETEFISIPEWARRLSISAESAYKAARLGEIPGCFNIGRLYRVNWPVFVDATASLRSGPESVS